MKLIEALTRKPGQTEFPPKSIGVQPMQGGTTQSMKFDDAQKLGVYAKPYQPYMNKPKMGVK
jgi:hypothetical protein